MKLQKKSPLNLFKCLNYLIDSLIDEPFTFLAKAFTLKKIIEEVKK